MANSKLQLQKSPPAWHAEAIQLLNENFNAIHAAFLDATKKAVWMGMFLNHIKDKGKADGSIPHGQFGPWLEKHVPQVSWNLCNTYMRLATGVCEKAHFQIVDFPQFAQIGHLPPEVEKVTEGKTQQQLFFEFKNVDADGNKRGRGRLPGESTPRDVRKTIEDSAELNESICNLWCGDTSTLIADGMSLAGAKTATLQRMEFIRLELGQKLQAILKSRGAKTKGL